MCPKKDVWGISQHNRCPKDLPRDSIPAKIGPSEHCTSFSSSSPCLLSRRLPRDVVHGGGPVPGGEELTPKANSQALYLLPAGKHPCVPPRRRPCPQGHQTLQYPRQRDLWGKTLRFWTHTLNQEGLSRRGTCSHWGCHNQMVPRTVDSAWF